MKRVWENILFPIFKHKNIKSIVEIGSEKGINTKNILEYCMENGGELISIDPEPMFDASAFEKEYEGHFKIYKTLSLESLPLLEGYDCILVDGDHNWYTVYNELQCINSKFNQDDFPLVFLHDASWPYGRRDAYYNPDDIPEEYQNEYIKVISDEECEQLEVNSLKTPLYKAKEENTPKNGVLTAIEDFIDDCELDLQLHFLPIFYGIAILHAKDDDLYEYIEKIIRDNDIMAYVDEFYIRRILDCEDLIDELKKEIEQKDAEISNLKQKLDAISN